MKVETVTSLQQPAHPVGHTLVNLINAAGLLELSASELAHPGLEEAGRRIEAVAHRFEIAPGRSLEQFLWTKPAALWDGTIARRLHEFEKDRFADNVGLLLAFAVDANARALFWSSARPLCAEHAFSGAFDVGGPYLVLMRCERRWTGNVVIRDGYALPVLDAHHPLPVGSAHERAVLSVLRKLVEVLDAHGLGCRLIRTFGPAGLGAAIKIRIDWRDGSTLEAAVVCLDAASPELMQSPLLFHATPGTIEDDTLVKWLEELIVIM